jgi:hypothetical protein
MAAGLAFMKHHGIILIILVMAARALADERLPVLKVGSQIYSNVMITRVTGTDIYFTYDKGMANVKLRLLDPELQKRFHYDAAKADATAKEQKAVSAQYNLQVGSNTNRGSGVEGLKAEMENAIAKVREIVNQPVTRLPQTPDTDVATYSPGWFHEGAEKPDFNRVDVRTTRQLSYEKHEYVTSDLNPGFVFKGQDLEFNAMTKYFYTDRSVPKKKLTEAEMLEINRLYRIIGRDEEELAKIQAARK